MAIGNMFQGMARGKVGDVVFAVREGKQVSRVRNRKPKNPQTNKQIMQRAIMATVLQAYSAGKEIFDHSFQGKSVGEQCAREFLSLNTKALRAAIAAEQTAATPFNEQKALVVLPKATQPVANAYIVSRGTYQQTLFTVDVDAGVLFLEVPKPTEGQTVAQYASEHGVIPGDIYTLVIFGRKDTDPSFVLNGYNSSDFFATDKGTAPFRFLRLQVKSTFANTAISKFGDLFELTAISNFANAPYWVENLPLEPINANSAGISLTNDEVFGDLPDAVAAGMIRSRNDEDLRSNTVLTPLKIAANPGTTWNTGGIVGGLAVQAWKQRTAQLGDSDLILEGGDV